MGKFAKILHLLLFVFVLNGNVSGQSKIESLRLCFELDTNTSSTAVTEPGVYKDASQFKVSFVLNARSLQDLAQIQVTMGSSKGGTEYFSRYVNANGEGLPEGVSMLIEGTKLTVNAGTYELQRGQCFARARLKYSNGQFSKWKKVDDYGQRTF